jgi:hypothetical protein
MYCKFYGPVEEYKKHKCAELEGECLICRNLLAKPCMCCEAAKDYASEKVHICNYTKQICTHQFHDHCLERWVKKINSCPLCDGPIQMKRKLEEESNSSKKTKTQDFSEI